MNEDRADEVEASDELSVRLAELRNLLHDMTVGGSLLGSEVSVVTSSAIRSLWRSARSGEIVADPSHVAAEVQLLARAAAAVDRALFDCPLGTRPSPVEWRYVPSADLMELRCLHDPPPGHCWAQQGSHCKRVRCV
jgi:hypothetical protein